jgi:hypothetical protein
VVACSRGADAAAHRPLQLRLDAASGIDVTPPIRAASQAAALAFASTTVATAIPYSSVFSSICSDGAVAAAVALGAVAAVASQASDRRSAQHVARPPVFSAWG